MSSMFLISRPHVAIPRRFHCSKHDAGSEDTVENAPSEYLGTCRRRCRKGVKLISGRAEIIFSRHGGDDLHEGFGHLREILNLIRQPAR